MPSFTVKATNKQTNKATTIEVSGGVATQEEAEKHVAAVCPQLKVEPAKPEAAPK